MRRAALAVFVAVVFLAAVQVDVSEAAVVVPIGGKMTAFLYEAATLSGSTTSIPAKIAVNGASRWVVAAGTASSLSGLAAFVVTAMAFAGAGVLAYQGWKAAADYYNGQPVAGVEPGAVLVAGNSALGQDPNKLYVKWTSYDLPSMGCWKAACGGMYLDASTVIEVMHAYPYGTPNETAMNAANAWRAANPTWSSPTASNGADQSAINFRASWISQKNISGVWNVKMWPIATRLGSSVDNYRVAAPSDVAGPILAGVAAQNTVALNELNTALRELQTAVADNAHQLRSNAANWADIATGLNNLVSQGDWDGVAADAAAMTPQQQAAAQGSGTAAGNAIVLELLAPMAYQQLTNTHAEALARYGGSKLTAAEAEQAHKNALAEDRALREAPGGLSQSQAKQAVGEALTEHRAAEKTAADAEATPTPLVFDPEVQTPEKKNLGAILTAGKNAALNLPWVGMVAGIAVQASGSPVVSGTVLGQTVNLDFSKYETELDFCGSFLLTLTFWLWGRKLLGVD